MNSKLVSSLMLVALLCGAGHSAQAQNETCRKLDKISSKNFEEVTKKNTNDDKIRKNYEEMLAVAGNPGKYDHCQAAYKTEAYAFLGRIQEGYDFITKWWQGNPIYDYNGILKATASMAIKAAELDYKNGKYSEALDKLVFGFKYAPADNSIRSRLNELSGDVLSAQGQYKFALDYYKKAEKSEKIAATEKILAERFANDTQAVKTDGAPDYKRQIKALEDKAWDLFSEKKYDEAVPLIDERIRVSLQASVTQKELSYIYADRSRFHSMIAVRDNSKSAANSCISDVLKANSLGWEGDTARPRLSQCYRVAGQYQKSYDALVEAAAKRSAWNNSKEVWYQTKERKEIVELYQLLFDAADVAGARVTRDHSFENGIEAIKKNFCEQITGTWKRKEVSYVNGERGVQYTFVANDTLNLGCDANGKITGTLDRSAEFSQLKGADGIFGQKVSGSLFANISSKMASKNGFFSDAQFSFGILNNGFRQDTLTSTNSGDTYKLTSSVEAGYGLKGGYENCSLTYLSKDGKTVTTFICDEMKTAFQKQ